MIKQSYFQKRKCVKDNARKTRDEQKTKRAAAAKMNQR